MTETNEEAALNLSCDGKTIGVIKPIHKDTKLPHKKCGTFLIIKKHQKIIGLHPFLTVFGSQLVHLRIPIQDLGQAGKVVLM